VASPHGSATVAGVTQRIDPPLVGDERVMLDHFLDYHRATLLWKCDGLSDEQLRQRSCPPSTLSLVGLVRHLTEVENGWFCDFVDAASPPPYTSEDNPEGDFADVDTADVAAAVAAFRAQCAASRAAVAALPLDATHTERDGRVFSLRWIYLHMFEEYARHNGHADLLRERIDGAVGE
jgi:Protein of unknown function (DUF664)